MRVLLIGINTPTGASIEAAFAAASLAPELFAVNAIEDVVATVREAAPALVLVAEHAVEACVTVGEESDAPILVLLDGCEIDRRWALHLGATAFVRQPFRAEDLVARARAALRLSAAPAGSARSSAFEAGTLRIDYAARSVTVSGRAVRLSAAEYGILYHLTRHAGRALSHRMLLSKVWGREFAEELECLDVQVDRLRDKLGDAGTGPPGITSRYRAGFAFVADSVEGAVSA